MTPQSLEVAGLGLKATSLGFKFYVHLWNMATMFLMVQAKTLESSSTLCLTPYSFPAVEPVSFLFKHVQNCTTAHCFSCRHSVCIIAAGS